MKSAATAPEIPAREGYTFTGWSAEFTSVSGDLAVDAVFTKNPTPAKPSVNTVTDSSKKISGKAVKGGEVYVKVGTKTYKKAVASNGTWSISVSKALKAGTKITVTVKKAGVTSKAATAYVVPAVPSVKTIKANSTAAKGTASKGGKVYVKIGKKTYKATASKKNGSYSVKIPKTKKGTKVTVWCEAGGKKSGTKVVKVK